VILAMLKEIGSKRLICSIQTSDKNAKNNNEINVFKT